MTGNEGILRKLRRLRSLAERQVGNEAEALAAAEKMQELLLKYNLGMEDLGDEDRPQEATVDEIYFVGKQGMKWKQVLCNGIANMMFCKILICGDNENIIFIGKPDNMKAAQELFEMLILKGEHFASWAVLRKPQGQNARSYTNDFLLGFSHRVALKCQQRLEYTRTCLPGSAGLVRNLQQEAEDYMYSKFNVGKAKTLKARTSTEAYKKGWDQAEEVQFNKALK